MLKNVIKKNTYFDSVTLMAISKKISGLDGVEKVAVMMATENNKEILNSGGLLAEAGKQSTPADLIIAFLCNEESLVSKIVDQVEKALTVPQHTGKGKSSGKQPIRTLATALKKMPEANLAIISVPGEYAAREAIKALENGLNVFLFSDNVTIADELMLKKKALKKGLLMMGPDCGTAYLNGAALGFANAASKGDIGIVAASGTGLQEVACLISKNGAGISHAIGTGGRDLKAEIGGITMLQGIEMLAANTQTEVIVLISKPPAPEVEKRIIQALTQVKKPVVTCFLGGDKYIEGNNICFAQTLEEAAIMASALSRGGNIALSLNEECSELKEIARYETDKFNPDQKYVCGLFSGGTLCYETMLIFQGFGVDVYSNVALKSEFKLSGSQKLTNHKLIDLGDDEFTQGRPHPMIDPTLRKERFLDECDNSGNAVILVDVVLGYGSHIDPAGELADAIYKAKDRAAKENRHLCFIASVCGTNYDPQDYNAQVSKLEKAGVVVMSSNAEAARLAARIAQNLAKKGGK